MHAIQRLRKADAAGVGVVQIKIRLEEFLLFGSRIARSVAELLRFLAPGLHGGRGRPFANGGAQGPAIAHQQQRGYRLPRVKQDEQAALPPAGPEGEWPDEWP